MASGWDAYVKMLLESSGEIRRAAIMGQDGVVWAQSEGGDRNFQVSILGLINYSHHLYTTN
jgi:hypothetical protein